ncbi:MAG: sulfatase-like hydrolase/transferase [Gemmatimonadetes bacterium]|nr:sulfatase-like hydrolase/transferase [Gemmatimonadota bacterium]
MSDSPVPSRAPDAPLTAGGALRLAAWLGALAGFGEVLLQYAVRYGWHRFNFTGRDLPWLTPAAYTLLFLLLGLLLLAAGAALPRLRRPGVFLGVLTVPAVASLAFMYPPLHKAAALLLAVGVAVQVSRWSVGEGWLLRLGRATWAVPLLLIVACFAGVRGKAAWDERRAVEALPFAPVGAPNILVIFLDTVREQSVNLADSVQGPTPFLARLAGRGTRFSEARSPAPWTLPSHASAFTGKPARALDADWMTPLDPTTPVLAQELAKRGWVTGGFVGNTLYCSRETGLARGFTYYRDYTAAPGEWVRSVSLLRVLHGTPLVRRVLGIEQLLGRKEAPSVSDGFLAWLDRRPRNRPYFAFLNYFDAHNPYIPPPAFRAGLPDGLPSMELETMAPGDLPGEAVLDDLRTRYERTIQGLDHELGRLFDSLAARGALDSTIVVLTSDHGEQFGEHRRLVHGNSLYLPVLHVPLIVVQPGRVPAGRVVTSPVALYDLPATLMELAGIPRAPFPGSSLVPLWDGRAPDRAETILASVNYSPLLRKVNPVSRGDITAVEQDGHRLIRQREDEELYATREDPGELTNLAPANPGGRLTRMRTALDSALARWTKPVRGARP